MGRVLNKALEADLLADLAADVRLKMPETLVFLPNQRACGHLKELLLAQGSQFLPRIMPLGDLDDLWLLEHASQRAGDGLDDFLAIPQPIKPHQAHMLLAQHLQREQLLGSAAPLEQAYAAACSVWEMFDAVWGAGFEIEALERLSRGDLSEHWRDRVALLRRCARWWQEYSRQHSMISETQRRVALARWLANLWQSHPPKGAVMIAGSTGTQASTLALMQAALRLDAGELWLQGADAHWLAESAGEVAESHPQALFGRLLQTLNTHIDRAQEESVRAEALFAGFRSLKPVALPCGIVPLRADNETLEAELAALIAKEALTASDDARVAIVLQDAAGARRMQAALRQFGLLADSAVSQDALSVPAMRLLLLITQAAAQPSDAVLWLALVKQSGAIELAEAIEKHWLRRRLYVQPMLARLMKWCGTEHADAVQRAQAERITLAMRPLLELAQAEQQGDVLMDALEKALLALHSTPLSTNEARLLQEVGSAFRALSARVEMEDVAALLRALLMRLSAVEQGDKTLRLKIYTPIEARLMQADRWILCGLNEQHWPPSARDHPWLHPFLARQLALPPEEQHRAQSALDFITLSGRKGEVFWLYSQQRGGVDQLASRFVERFECTARQGNAPYLSWLRAAGNVTIKQARSLPAPAASLSDWPQRLSVTAIRMLLNNPFGFYAKYLLGLRRLDPIDRPADGAQRGDLVHAFMEQLTERLNAGESISFETYDKAAKAVLAEQTQPIVRHQWAPRIYEMADAILALEQARRADGRRVVAEEEIAMQFAGTQIYGRPDRLELLPDGRFAVIDYKTGNVPNDADIERGREPQLPLLAAMQGSAGCAELAYWKLSGVRGEVSTKPLKFDSREIIDFYCEGTARLLDYYRRDGAVFPAQILPEKEARYDDYALLARPSISSSS